MATLTVPDAAAKYWLREIASYESRQSRARWELWSRQAVGAYSLTSGDRRLVDTVEDDIGKKRYNIFWSNIENLKPGMYSRTPKVVVSRRHTGSRDPVAKTGADVLEKVIAYQLSEHGFGSAVRAARDDYLLVGRGVTWVRYKGHELEMPGATPPATPGDDAPPPKTMLDFEEIILDYVHWSDFGHTDARRWEDVLGVWRRIRMDKAMAAGFFGAEWAEKLTYDAATIRSDTRSGNDRGDEGAGGDNVADGEGLATIYEVWDAHKRHTLFVAQGQKQVLKTEDGDPLKLPRFFPCSRPIYATLANDDLFPVSDYRQYRTQIRQIQVLTQRIEGLTEAAKLVGVYDATEEKLKTLFDHPDGTLIPVTNWAALAGKGGLDASISFVPIKEIAETLQILHNERDRALADSYQLTGISDLIRGDTQASETATAQGIKDKYISMRFDEKRREIDRAVANTLNIYGAIVCHVFSNETIIQMSGVQLFRTGQEKQQCQQQIKLASTPPPPPEPGVKPPPRVPMPDAKFVEMCERPAWDEVLQFLRNDALRSFHIDIESDSTVARDQQAQQEGAAQFLSMLGGFLSQAMEAAKEAPQLIPLFGRMMSWGMRQFPVGRDLEEAVDTAVDKMEQQARKAEQNPPPQPPDPQLIKVQQDGEIAKARLELDHQKLQQDGQIEQAKLEADVTLKNQDMAHTHSMAQMPPDNSLEHAKLAASMQAEREKMDATMQAERDKQDRQIEFDQWKADLDARTKIEVAEIAAGTTLQAAQIAAAGGNAPDDADSKPENGEGGEGAGHKALASAIEGMTATIGEMRKPKKVIRGGDGKIAGIE